MLFMLELNTINCKVFIKIFKMIDSKTAPNINNKDFIEWSKTEGKYNVIMRNLSLKKIKMGKTFT